MDARRQSDELVWNGMLMKDKYFQTHKKRICHNKTNKQNNKLRTKRVLTQKEKNIWLKELEHKKRIGMMAEYGF